MQVFLSYRRADASAWAGRLGDDASTRFGRDAVFQDVVGIDPGERFPMAIESALAMADVVLAVIGPRWLEDAAGGSRLADPGDYVRRELLSALEQDKRIIPVLVGGAVLPSAAQLPPELASLVERQAVALRDDRWRADVDGLLRALGDEPEPAALHRRGTSRLVALAAAIVAVAVAGWLMLGDRDGDGGETAPGNVPSEVCPTPEGAGWTALAATDDSGDFIDGRWSLLVPGGGYRRVADGDAWEVVVRPRLVNRADVAQPHRDMYRLVVDDAAYEPTCFQIQSGPEDVGPEQISDALVGFKVDQEPLGTISLDADDEGQHMRVPVSAS